MVEIISYIFSLLVILYLIYSNVGARFLGMNKIKYNISSSWITIYVLYATYMFGYCEYNSLIPIFVVFLYLMNWQVNIQRTPFYKSYLKWYLFFIIWCTFCFFYSSDVKQGVLMLIKLTLPIVFYIIADSGFKNTNTWVFVEKIAKLPIYYFLLCLVSIPFSEFVPIYHYFGMAIFPFPFIMYVKTKRKKYLLYCLLCFSGNIIGIKRTPMLGVLSALLVYFIYKYKYKAVMPLIAAIVIFLSAIWYIPSLSNKMFFEGVDMNEIPVEILFSDEIYNYINTNGRSVMWETAIEKFYTPNEFIGAGLGTLKSWLLSRNEGTFLRLHNDWIHLMCETGLIGIGLLIAMFVEMYKTTFMSFNKTPREDIKYISVACAMSCTTTIVHMYFENCIGVFGYYVPFILSAIFFNYLKYEK